MKKLCTLLLVLLSCWMSAQVTTTPNPPTADAPVTIHFNKAGTPLAGYNGTIYVHLGLTVDGTPWQNLIGSWGNNTTQPALTLVSGTNYKLDITPDLYAYFGVSTASEISQLCMVFRAASGAPQTSDLFVNVGAFQLMTLSPAAGSNTIVAPNGSLPISASSSLPAQWELKVNGTVAHSVANSATFSYNQTVTADHAYELTATHVSSGTTITRAFTAITTPTVVSQPLPTGMQRGINYHPSDPTKATLVLYAPLKNYVHVIGSFNNYALQNSYLMKRNSLNSNEFWIELTGLTPSQIYTFQYRTNDGIKTADPHSTLVLSPFDDPYITEAEYPNLPAYPEGQNFEVTVLQTAAPTYNWQVPNFVKPEKTNLAIYELLIRDFTEERTFQSLIDRMDYFTSLNINAIQLMPIMEFEGNNSWGYNTSFHMALDKAYGPADKLKEFVDLCHQNGIAVILDVALNHVYGRSPLVRMWMDDPDGNGFGNPSSTNPYMNANPMHTYNVGSDFNHSKPETREYVRRVVEYWMNEFKIDGFRWDLTKGFTQNCSGSNETCTNAYQADRVAVLKQYADYQWALDETSYVIFEHLGFGGSAQEEIEWSNYKLSEGKGIMLWGKMTNQYNQNTMGYTSDSNLNNMLWNTRNFGGPMLVGYPESHDEERMMYKNFAFGNSANSAHNVKNTNIALMRQKALAATSLLLPGPKMIWQFQELGYDKSIFMCSNGTVPTPYGNDSCKLDPKPSAFELGYDTEDSRGQVYDVYAKLLQLRQDNPVFATTTASIDSGNLTVRQYIWDNSLAADELKNVVILANFNVTAQDVVPHFPYTGTWYNLMDNSSNSVTSTTAAINLQPGEFRIYGNQAATLGQTEVQTTRLSIYPNPSKNNFYLTQDVASGKVYSIAGQLVHQFGVKNANDAVELSSLARGLYLVRVVDSQGNEQTLKWMKE